MDQYNQLYRNVQHLLKAYPTILIEVSQIIIFRKTFNSYTVFNLIQDELVYNMNYVYGHLKLKRNSIKPVYMLNGKLPYTKGLLKNAQTVTIPLHIKF